jgi:RNA polymerase sigma-70 factor (ECF subfamily)
LGQLVDREPEALAEVYDQYGRAVYALSLRILGDPAAAEDVTHDVFLKLWRRPEHYRVDRGSLRSWLLAVAHNRAIDVVRRGRTAMQVLAFDRAGQEALRHDVVAASDPVDLAEHAAQVEDASRVRRALAQIPPAQRQAIEMAFFEGKTHLEISAELGEPLGTAKTRIRLGMRKLRSLLDEDHLHPSAHAREA